MSSPLHYQSSRSTHNSNPIYWNYGQNFGLLMFNVLKVYLVYLQFDPPYFPLVPNHLVLWSAYWHLCPVRQICSDNWVTNLSLVHTRPNLEIGPRVHIFVHTLHIARCTLRVPHLRANCITSAAVRLQLCICTLGGERVMRIMQVPLQLHIVGQWARSTFLELFQDIRQSFLAFRL